MNPDQRRDLLDVVPETADVIGSGNVLPHHWVQGAEQDPGLVEFATRMLHSALVDADLLDTAAHFNATPLALREEADFAALAERFERSRSAQLAGAPVTGVNQAR